MECLILLRTVELTFLAYRFAECPFGGAESCDHIAVPCARAEPREGWKHSDFLLVISRNDAVEEAGIDVVLVNTHQLLRMQVCPKADYGVIPSSIDFCHGSLQPFTRCICRLTTEMVEYRAQDNVIVVTFGNYAFMDFILTWVKHLADLNVFNLLIGAMDTKLLMALYWKGVPIFDMGSNMNTIDGKRESILDQCTFAFWLRVPIV